MPLDKERGNKTQNILTRFVSVFHIFSQVASAIVGHAGAFLSACLFIVIWFISGVFFDFSAKWMLFISASTNVVIFLMVFLIQNMQNRFSKSTQLKLDELIRVHRLAHISVIDLDKLTDEQINELEQKYKALTEAKRARDIKSRS